MVKTEEANEGDVQQVVEAWRRGLPGLDAEAFSLQVKLYELHQAAGRIYNGIANEFSLNHIDLRILMVVCTDSAKGSVRPSDLGRLLHLAPSAITYRLDRLHDMGLLERLTDESDRRAFYLKLTDGGEHIVKQVVRRLTEATTKRLAMVREQGGNPAELDRQLELYLKAWNAP